MKGIKLEKQAYIYARWSSADQGQGTTAQRQREICENYCAANNLQIVGSMVDDGVSAYSGDNLSSGLLGEFSAKIVSGEIEGDNTVLVVEEPDRLSRLKPVKVLGWLDSVTECGLSIALVNLGLTITNDTLDDFGQFIALSSSAHSSNNESERKSRRLKEKNRIKRKELRNGQQSFAKHKPPAWLRKDNGEYTIIENRAQLITEIFDLATQGHGKDSIARIFNERYESGDKHYDTWTISNTVRGDGTTKVVKAQKWQASRIGRILHEQAVIGYYQPFLRPRTGTAKPEGEPIKVYPAVVEVDVYNRVNEPRERNMMKQQGRGRKVSNFVAGKCVCHRCDGPMTARGSSRISTLKDGTRRQYYNYYCDNAKTGKGCKHQRGWSLTKLEKVLMDELLMRALDDQYFADPQAEVLTLANITNELKRLVKSKSDHLKLLAKQQNDHEDLEEIGEIFDEIASDLRLLKVRLKSSEKELAEKRGRVSQPEHLKRVNEIRSMIDSDNENEVYQARSTIKAALQEIIEVVEFDDDSDNIIVKIVGGVSTLIILDNGKEWVGSFAELSATELKNAKWKAHKDAAIIDAYLNRIEASDFHSQRESE